MALGVLEVLCQHAHSGNAEMQCNALWALKHLVQASSTDVKRQCWKELGQQWLIDAISMSHEGCRSTHDADGDSRMEASDDDAAMGVECSDASENDLCEYEREEVDKARSSLPKFRKDRFSVLEQSLGFLRNLIGGYTSSSNCNNSEMIDLLFREWGEDQLFTILESKLEPRVETTGFTGARQAFNNAGPVIFPETEIIVSVQYILVNIAASIPQHREAIMRRKALLELLLTHFSHPRSEVRLSLCWLITNLIYVDSDVDEYGQLGRVRELAKLGYASKLDSLLTDVNVDVRERAKTALHYMRSHVV